MNKTFKYKCKVHGYAWFRWYKNGYNPNGNPKTVMRCLICEADRRVERKKRKREMLEKGIRDGLRST